MLGPSGSAAQGVPTRPLHRTTHQGRLLPGPRPGRAQTGQLCVGAALGEGARRLGGSSEGRCCGSWLLCWPGLISGTSTPVTVSRAACAPLSCSSSSGLTVAVDSYFWALPPPWPEGKVLWYNTKSSTRVPTGAYPSFEAERGAAVRCTCASGSVTAAMAPAPALPPLQGGSPGLSLCPRRHHSVSQPRILCPCNLLIHVSLWAL